MLLASLSGAGGVLLILGVMLIVLAVLLLGTAVVVTRAAALHVRLDQDGYRIQGRGVVEQGTWSEVVRVTGAADRITLVLQSERRVQLLVPRAVRAELDALSAEIAARLDADRGYGRPVPNA